MSSIDILALCRFSATGILTGSIAAELASAIR